MHAAVLDWVKASSLRIGPVGRVMDQGGRNVNGGIRHLFPDVSDWTAVDMSEGVGVDVVADCGDYVHPYPCDLVTSTELLEHTPRGRDIVRRAYESLAPGGYYVITTAAPGRGGHNADGGPRLLPGEYYANIDPVDLESWLRDAGFVEIEIDVQGPPASIDLRSFARKPLR